MNASATMVALHAEHARPLWGYVLRLTHDRGRAEDVVQETLLRAWRTPGVLDAPPDRLRAWLFTVARRLVVDEWRSARARHEQVLEHLPEPPTDEGRWVDEVLEGWLVAEALARLTPEHREVLVLCYYRGMSVGAAAERLGIPPGTVKSRTHYALRGLRLALQEMGVTR